jgi:hypothetical protein
MDRLWRNNRQPYANTTCIGVNMNRNWPFKWNFTHPMLDNAASDDPCDDSFNFRGFSEGDSVEVAALLAFKDAILQANSHGIKWYVDFHSSAQTILLPYGDCVTPNPLNYATQLVVAEAMAAAVLKSDNRTFPTLNTCDWTDRGTSFTGIASDYMSSIGVPYSWAVELRSRVSGEGGFELLPIFILPSGIEMWDGVKTFLHTAV